MTVRSARRLARRSGAIVLALACASPVTGAGPASAQPAPPVAPLDVPVTEKVGVTDAYQNPSVAVDPTNHRRVAIAYYEGSVLDRCYLALSRDGGTTWATQVFAGTGGDYPGANEVTNRCYSPAVAFGPDGTLYYVLQSAIPNDRTPDQLKVYVSEDGGRGFRGPTVVGVQEGPARSYWPSMAVDQRSGRVHLAWSEHPGPPVPGRILASFSDDKAASFSAPVAISPADQMFPQSPQVAAGTDGSVYVVYGSELDNNLWSAVSTDRGASYGAPVMIDKLLPTRTFGAGPPQPVSPLYASFGPRYMSVVAGPEPGRAAVAFWDTRGPDGLARVSVSSTADAGGTWSSPRLVGAPAGREGDNQLNAFLSIAPGGRLDLAYYVREGLEGAHDVYLASSDDGGGSFSAARRLNEVSFSSTVGPPGFFGVGVRFGDYLGVASTDAGAVVAWTDTRRGDQDDGHQDIFFATTVPGSLGYRLVAADGGVFGFGEATFLGGTGGARLNRPIVAAAATPSGRGYWLVASDGGAFAFGDARFHGSTAGVALRQPVTAMVPTPTGRGYWLAAADGGVFAFGDAAPFGSAAAVALNRPVVAMAATPSGRGYWLVAADGGLFAFGDARYLGSTGALRLNRPIVAAAATPTGDGYWLVGSDGGVFAFGDAGFFGSTGALALNRPIVAAAATVTGRGYWLVAADGGVFAFGDARFAGSTAALPLHQPIVAAAGM